MAARQVRAAPENDGGGVEWGMDAEAITFFELPADLKGFQLDDAGRARYDLCVIQDNIAFAYLIARQLAPQFLPRIRGEFHYLLDILRERGWLMGNRVATFRCRTEALRREVLAAVPNIESRLGGM
jgi:hypothetical protein